MHDKTLRSVRSALFCLVASSSVSAVALADDKPRADAKASIGGTAKVEAGPVSPAPAAPVPATPVAAPEPGAGATPSPEVVAEAKQRFDRGFELYTEGDYPLALIEFNRAYALVPNYRVLYNIGQVCIQLAQYANARRALEEYRDKGGSALPPERREAITKDLEMLERRTAYLAISSNVPEAEVYVDDVLVGKTPLGPALLVDAGVHRISARRQGYLQRTSSVTLAGGDKQLLALTLEVMPEEKQTIVVRERERDEGPSALLIAGWVTTGALATGAIVTGILGAGKAGDLKTLRGADPRDFPTDPDTGESTLGARMQDTKDSASTLLLTSDILSGAALVVGGLSLWITIDPPESPKPADSTDPTLPPAKALQVGYEAGRLGVRGTF
jgi:hypothetical protein